MMVDEFNASSKDQTDKTGAQNTGGATAADVVLIAVGTVLVAAAFLKIDAILTRQWPASYIKILEALMETTVGLWCWCGVWRRAAWAVTVLLFLVFAGVSLFRGWAGHQSCGCFGDVRVNPWWTLGLDAGILVALLVWRPRRPVPKAATFRLMGTGFMLLLLLAAGGWLMVRNRPARLHADGRLTGGTGTVWMNPVRWTHHRLPLLQYMRHAQLYAHGRWLVVLYHHGCQVCWQAIGQVAAKLAVAKHPQHVLLLEVPPNGSLPASLDLQGMVHAKVHFGRAWAIPMFPLYLDLHDGVVTRVRVYVKGYWSGF